MSKEKRRTSSKHRKVLTKTMLLPLSAAVAQRKSLEHHLALTTLKYGHGNLDVVGRLFRAIYVAYFVQDMTSRISDLSNFRAAEAALSQCAVRGKRDDVWLLSDDGHSAIETILLLHDQQLATARSHTVASAQERIATFLTTEALSPFPSSSV
ncbi:hypothetical protein [Burkholderia catarinensis]|uniref:hypothetical protein n=1 Tax=Burkholderia catarinensis TaxID=1108140 RepID=UPI00091891C0|nr:hypothetical protein [Burkholderia catarinensis]KAG8148459.1 hypothetical protein BFF94_037850 [Burkholderia catarinensis]